MINQKIDEGPDARGKMFMASKDRMDQLFIIRVPFWQDFDQCSGLDIGLNMEPAQPRHAKSRKAEAAHGRAAVALEIARYDPAETFASIGIDERPFIHRDGKVEPQAIVTVQFIRMTGQAACGDVFRRCDDGAAAFDQFACFQ